MNDNETNVELLDVITSHDVPVSRVLTGALAEELTDVVIVGWCKNGESYFASSLAGGPQVLWLLELAKKDLMRIGSQEPIKIGPSYD